MSFAVTEVEADRFWAKVAKGKDCWMWTAGTRTRLGGYGSVRIGGRTQQSHRVAYQMMVGPIPEGLQLDHLCRVRRCVRPDHLEPVTNRENILRGDTFAARNVARTHCPYGHAYDQSNTIRGSRGGRHCRTCVRKHQNVARDRANALAGRTRQVGVKHWKARLSESDVAVIRERAAAGERQILLAREFNMSPNNVCKIVLRKAWSHIP